MTLKRVASNLWLRFVCTVAFQFVAADASAAPLRLAVSDGPVSLPVYVAQARGYFEAEHVAVNVTTCASGLACLRALQNGAADVATAAEMPVALSVDSAKDIAILATISSSSHQIKLVARRSAGIDEPKSLAGKRVGTVLGTSAQYFLESWLVFHELDPRAIEVVAIEPNQLEHALASRAVDAVAIWEPIASDALEKLGADGIALRSPRVYTQYFNLVGRRAALHDRAAELAELLRALIRAQEFIEHDSAATSEILKSRLRIGQPLADSTLREQDFRIRLDQSLVTTMSSELRWAGRNKRDAIPGASVNPLLLIDPSILERVEPAAVRLDR